MNKQDARAESFLLCEGLVVILFFLAMIAGILVGYEVVDRTRSQALVIENQGRHIQWLHEELKLIKKRVELKEGRM